MSKKDKPIDWAGIERDFRAGVMSNREIARWYGLSETAIRKKAKAEGWERREAPRHVKREVIVPEIVEVRTPIKPEDLADRGRGLAGRMLDELEAVTTHQGELEDMIFVEESDPRRRQALMKALSLSERAMTLRNLANAMKTLNESSAPQGKKAARDEAAKAVGGRFGVRQPPKLAVDNTK